MAKSVVNSWSDAPQLPMLSGVPAQPATPTGIPASASPWGGVKTQSQGLEPHFQEHYQKYIETRTPEAATNLLTAVSPIIDKALKSYAGGESNTTTLRARAKTMALEAVRRYDPKQARLETHLLSHLRGLRRVTERSTSAVYVAEAHKLDRRKLDAVKVDMADELGREPSDAEMSDRLGIPIERVARARGVPKVLSSSQTGGEVGGVGKIDPKSWETWVRAIHADSGPIDQVILERSLGMHGHEPMPAHEIAKMLGLSPAAVSLRKQRLQRDLDEYQNFLGQGAG